ncbi:Mitochondrial carnitine/acylcarnitine carrier protein [Wickerhamomyces ciferrii]|uniref:Mitochondrial carnitine/acylcarnitine carrier protein n=1 Tax=Wickerhamomyces ciferrii (strain ATCC 14091 / BCRC 22168 / CBS 111 / JCM 3599 / NBRC 0793 / NRRL Y-1031 F-60-10) TaxID=1206466 RepID=K0KHK4_WICCF|nr:Mitochondrial carnitine/acylcarnitine carrier protein [Wickerhamomyces ciferrii]CCH42496.1 Mitochondrial carnitine/acylcarnitine carrier protein [Wickerhamomyces ciferrii]
MDYTSTVNEMNGEIKNINVTSRVLKENNMIALDPRTSGVKEWDTDSEIQNIIDTKFPKFPVQGILIKDRFYRDQNLKELTFSKINSIETRLMILLCLFEAKELQETTDHDQLTRIKMLHQMAIQSQKDQGLMLILMISLNLERNVKNKINKNTNSLYGGAKIIYQLDGVKGFWKGIKPRIISNVPSTAICWTAYEMAKYYLTRNQSTNSPSLISRLVQSQSHDVSESLTSKDVSTPKSTTLENSTFYFDYQTLIRIAKRLTSLNNSTSEIYVCTAKEFKENSSDLIEYEDQEVLDTLEKENAEILIKVYEYGKTFDNYEVIFQEENSYDPIYEAQQEVDYIFKNGIPNEIKINKLLRDYNKLHKDSKFRVPEYVTSGILKVENQRNNTNVYKRKHFIAFKYYPNLQTLNKSEDFNYLKNIIGELHSKLNVTHGDLKIDNVYKTPANEIVLLDFNIGNVLDEMDDNHLLKKARLKSRDLKDVDKMKSEFDHGEVY